MIIDQELIDAVNQALDEKHFTPGKSAVGSGINALAWQLRSGSLAVKDGRVVLFFKMLLNATPVVLETVKGRAAAINQIIDQADLHPADLAELISTFNELENKQ